MSPWWWPVVGVIGLVALLFLFATGCAVVGAILEWQRSERGLYHPIPRRVLARGIV